jgi:hypothetical protein
MKTNLPLMGCKLSPTTCVTRNILLLYPFFLSSFGAPISKLKINLFRYARCTRSVSIGKPDLTLSLISWSPVPAHRWCSVGWWCYETYADCYLDCLQYLLRTMLTWQPSELASTWSRIPLTVGLWRAVLRQAVALHQRHATPGLVLGMLLWGHYLPSRKMWSASCSTAKIDAALMLYLRPEYFSKYLHCFGDAGTP